METMWKDYEEYSVLFVNGLSKARVSLKNFKTFDDVTGKTFTRSCKAHDLDEAKEIALTLLKEHWSEVYKTLKSFM